MSSPWPNTDPPTAHCATAAARAALARVSATVAVAAGLVAAGREVDLAGLDAAAGRLCAQVIDLPPADGAALREGMIALNHRVAALMDTLRAAADPVPRWP